MEYRTTPARWMEQTRPHVWVLETCRRSKQVRTCWEYLSRIAAVELTVTALARGREVLSESRTNPR